MNNQCRKGFFHRIYLTISNNAKQMSANTYLWNPVKPGHTYLALKFFIVLETFRDLVRLLYEIF